MVNERHSSFVSFLLSTAVFRSLHPYVDLVLLSSKGAGLDCSLNLFSRLFLFVSCASLRLLVSMSHWMAVKFSPSQSALFLLLVLQASI